MNLVWPPFTLHPNIALRNAPPLLLSLLVFSVYFGTAIYKLPNTVSYQSEAANRLGFVLLDGRDSSTLQALDRRPFYVWWFMNQLAM